MFTQKISIANAAADLQDILEQFYNLLGTLRQGGQIIGEEYPVYNQKDALVAIVMTLESDSLLDKYASKYSLRAMKELGTTIKIDTLGDCIEGENQLCDCKDPASYILYTNYLKLGSPLHCGDCFGEIPLYKLKSKEGYWEIMSWESDYVACDSLQMNCSVGEVFGLEQMFDINSSLSQLGIKQTQQIEALVNKPVYYYLYNYQEISKEKDQERKCPNCNNDWFLEERLHQLFDFKCEDCKLLSNLSHNSA